MDLRRPQRTLAYSGLLAAAIGCLPFFSCTTVQDSGPEHRVDYIGQGTFRWGSYQGFSLISISDTGRFPQITTGGSFSQEGVRLILAEDAEDETSGKVLPLAYIPPAGDSVRVDFSNFPNNGRVKITRRHCGLEYVRDLLETRSDGLEVVGHERVELSGDPDPADIINFGNAYFGQRPDADLAEARCRFFRAGAHYPELAIQLLRRHENRAEEERNRALGAETLAYRLRFEVLEELARAAPAENQTS